MARGHKWTTLLAGLAASGAWACERMEPSGNVLAPVKVSASAGGEAAAPAIEDLDPDFAVAEPIHISSEELRGSASADEDGAADAGEHGEDSEDGVTVAETETPEDTSEAAVTAPPAALAPAPIPTPDPLAFGAQWPVRLVSTTPTAQPPMAILGFANGETVAVFPGTMVPDHNLVVMAIGQNTVEVARIAPNGDHALVAQTTLSALN